MKSRTRHHRSKARIEPTRQNMLRMLSEGGVSLTAKQSEQLWTFHHLLRQHNKDRDLTRIIGFESTVIKHYLDCLIVGELTRLPSPLLDIGTGAGFPGIPLKIRYPSLDVILAEPRPGRVAFLKLVIKSLGLTGIEVFEHHVVSASFSRQVKGVITRAVETIERTIQRTTAALRSGGLLIFMKGPNCDSEVKETLMRFHRTITLESDIRYTLAKTPNKRRLIVLRRSRQELGVIKTPLQNV